MNKFRFSAIFYAALFFAVSSCGSNQSNENASTADSTIADSSATTANTMASSIVTSPQNMMVVTHRVANFSKWKASYDQHDSIRLAFGVHSYVVGRGIEDSNMVLVAVKVDDMDKAKAFSKDPSLRKAMSEGGVMGTPSMQFITMVWQDTGIVNSSLRSRTTFTVKDFETWRKSFETHRQTRVDNGLTDRAYGHDVDDDHKVGLVVAVNDTAKAKAFWKSDLLKQRRNESGVTSEPKRFLFEVVQRY